MTSSRTSFEYYDLQEGEARLVDIAPGKYSDQIQCTLSHTTFLPDVQYECLSYVWGPLGQGSAQHSIICDGFSFPVSLNLFSALFCLRYEDRPRVMWIDQICINQRNLAERTSQVLQMGNIYRSAQQVLLFAGSPGPQMIAAALFINLFGGTYGAAFFSDRENFKNVWKKSTVSQLKEHLDVPLPEEETWKCVRHLLNQPCFRRTWIVQEVALAQKIRILFSPGIEIDWDEDKASSFTTFFITVSARNHNSGTDHGHYIGREMIYSRALILARSQTRTFPESPSLRLLALLVITRRFEVTDPRDKIYGILSLATDSAYLDITPDYIKSIRDVYMNVARRLIQCMKSLDVLKHVETLKYDDSLPSWVPDWRSIRMELFGDDVITGTHFYNATRGMAPQLVEPTEPSKLGLRGVMLDVITTITSGPVEDGGQRSDGAVAAGHELWWIRAKTAIGPTYKPTGEDLSMALGRTRIADRRDDVQKFGGKKNDPIEVEEDEVRYYYFRSLGVIIQNQILYRNLITTENGFMGLVPLTAQEGDIIYLVPGCDTPLTLRRLNNNEFHFVGQCYVHGIMYGEAFPDDVSLEDIVLV
ncbi:HET-domain-containing protein [Hyaloscypha variabilis F]|uniref:HET-domain-containing protein n=1 Tax=Hyaloscypha variabilis (strain UAMH 11265 / GT02V1 / F) TaxID=1149755 RepID=A0A2J6R8V7_HYAVF|nr:HET-domain-containing protein [Hyaloscypha variabilis F]